MVVTTVRKGYISVLTQEEGEASVVTTSHVFHTYPENVKKYVEKILGLKKKSCRFYEDSPVYGVPVVKV